MKGLSRHVLGHYWNHRSLKTEEINYLGKSPDSDEHDKKCWQQNVTINYKFEWKHRRTKTNSFHT